MIREVKFESQDRRIKGIIEALNANGIKDIEEANAICEAAGLDPYKTCVETQPIFFENAKWAYVVGCAIAIKKGFDDTFDTTVLTFKFYFSNHNFFPPYIIRDVDQYV